ncbi:MAG: zinc-finger domain-containing protein [Hyphomonadaceae bacterium]|nr:zinc-finger domain-containing protein [Hyphomonadaceae bacterium]
MDAAPGSGPPPPEVIVVEFRRIACDGVGGALGHPRVFLEMGERDFVECGYCDRLYALRGGSRDPGAASQAGL